MSYHPQPAVEQRVRLQKLRGRLGRRRQESSGRMPRSAQLCRPYCWHLQRCSTAGAAGQPLEGHCRESRGNASSFACDRYGKLSSCPPELGIQTFEEYGGIPKQTTLVGLMSRESPEVVRLRLRSPKTNPLICSVVKPSQVRLSRAL